MKKASFSELKSGLLDYLSDGKSVTVGELAFAFDATPSKIEKFLSGLVKSGALRKTKTPNGKSFAYYKASVSAASKLSYNVSYSNPQASNGNTGPWANGYIGGKPGSGVAVITTKREWDQLVRLAKRKYGRDQSAASKFIYDWIVSNDKHVKYDPNWGTYGEPSGARHNASDRISARWDPKIPDGAIVEVSGNIMLKGLSPGKYRVEYGPPHGSTPTYKFFKPRGRRPVVRHLATKVDAVLRDRGHGDLNKVTVIQSSVSAAKDTGSPKGDKARVSKIDSMVASAEELKEAVDLSGFPEAKEACKAVSSLKDLSTKLTELQIKLKAAPNGSDEAAQHQVAIDDLRSGLDTMIPPLEATMSTMEELLLAAVSLDEQFAALSEQVKSMEDKLKIDKERLAAIAKAVEQSTKIGG